MGLLQTFRGWLGAGETPVGLGLQEVSYQRSQRDQTSRLRLSDLTPADLTAALDAAAYGNRYQLARIHNAMLSVDPDIRAAVRQLTSAICATDFKVTPGDDSEPAKQEADELAAMLGSLPVRQAKAYAVEAWIRGAGLVENLWNDPADLPRAVTGWRFVPEERIRNDRQTGEIAFAGSNGSGTGTPISAFERGKWIVLEPDRHLADYALRGVAPSLHREFLAHLDVFGWWLQRIERFGMPIPALEWETSAQKAAADDAIRNWSAAGGFSFKKGSTLNVHGGDSAVGATSPHAEFMLRSAQRVFLAVLGESQTGIIEQGAGSKQSADTQHAVMRYVVEDVCAFLEEAVSAGLIGPWREIRGNAGRWPAPKWCADLEEPGDAESFDRLVDAAAKKGVFVSENVYRERTGLPAPKPGESPVGASAADQRPALVAVPGKEAAA